MSLLHRKPQNVQIYPYNRMYRAVLKSHRKSWWLLIGLGIACLTAIMGYVNFRNKLDVTDLFTIILLYAFVGFISVILFVLIKDNILHTEVENKLIGSGLIFLKDSQYTQYEIESIGKRAEVGYTTGSNRTLITILMISISIPVIINYLSSNNSFLPINLIFPLTMITLFIVFSFVTEIDRANIDASIKQACIEFQCRQKQYITKRLSD